MQVPLNARAAVRTVPCSEAVLRVKLCISG